MDKILIEVVPHDKQRYSTVGDWFWENDDTLIIRVSNTANLKYNMLIAVHELVEAVLCAHNGVSQNDVDAFDMTYEGGEEPGDDMDAPYREEHCFATAVERMLCAAMGEPWTEYEERVKEITTVPLKKGRGNEDW